MATTILRPNGDTTAIMDYPIYGDHYTEVDEESQDGDTTTIGEIDANSFTPGLKLSSNTQDGTLVSLTTSYVEYSEAISRPGGGSWLYTDLSSLEVRCTSGDNTDIFTLTDWTEGERTIQSVEVYTWAKKIVGKLSRSYITQIYIVVTHVGVGQHPAPTGVQIDRSTNPTNASEDPLFSAIFEADGAETADEIYIEVATDNGFVTKVWESGWTAITGITDGQRSDEISYGGTYLSTDVTYYARIKFRDTAEKESDWSGTATMSGFTREWHDFNYTHRERLFWNADSNPNGIPAGYTQEFTIKTGERQIISTNGYFNEAVQASGGFQIEDYNGKTYVAILRKMDITDGYAHIGVIQYDNRTGEVLQEVDLGTALTTYDTHHFPVLCIDGDGRIWVFMSQHDGALYYWKSTNPEDITAFSSRTWISTVQRSTYPCAFLIPSSGRIYVGFRGGPGSNRYWSFVYTDNGGTSWSFQKVVIYDRQQYAYRVYCYGIRYDVENERLHISWTYNRSEGGEKELGVWYAYSDLDETDGSSLDVGFNIFREANGTLYGRTAALNYYDTQKPIGYNNLTGWAAEAARAIQFCSTDTGETDITHRVFSETLELLTDGSPVVFWEQNNRDNAEVVSTPATQETYLMSATWNGSSWDKNSIADQLNLKLRVRRSSVGVMTDRNGVMRLFMPVNGNTFHHFLPKADHDSIGVTRSTGTDNFALVDDGIALIDGDGTYIDIAASGKASFSNSADSMRDNVIINAVEVRFVAQPLTTAPSMKCYLDISSTEYDGDATTVDNATSFWTEYGHRWAINPSTSSAWTKSEVEGLQFGVKETGANYGCRITRVILRVEWLLASDNETAGVELAELSSTDGNTWTFVKWHSGNTLVGVPMMNHKHHLGDGERIDIIWVSGHDIFLLTDEPYTIFQGDMRDCRLYYGPDEIDRLIFNYANYPETLLIFKVQAAITAGDRTGAKDLLLYYGGPGVISQPKSDPNQILPFYENFLDYMAGSNLHGQGGWSVTSGTFQVYASPPDHANKLYAGDQDGKMVSAGEADVTVGTDLCNLLVEVGIWDEQGGNNYFALVDGASNIFGAGFDGDAGYTDGIWTDATNHKAKSKQPHRAGILLTANGCIPYLDGIALADLVQPTLVDFDKIRVKCTSNSFFDFITVRSRIHQLLADTGTMVRQLMDHNYDATSTYSAIYDAQWTGDEDGTGHITIEIEARVKFGETDTGSCTIKVHLCPEVPYNASNITDTDEVVIPTVNTSVWGSHADTIVFSGLTAGQYSVKADFYATTAALPERMEARLESVTAIYSMDEPILDPEAVEVQGIVVGGIIRGTGQDIMTVQGIIGGDKLHRLTSTILEHSQAVDCPAVIHSENKSSLEVPGVFHIENKSAIEVPGMMQVENKSAIEVPSVMPVENKSAIEVPGVMPVENKSAIEVPVVVRVENKQSTADISRAIPVENCTGVNAKRQASIEYLSSITAQRQVWLEWISLLTAIRSTPVSWGLSVISPCAVPLEYSQQMPPAAGVATVEFLSSIAADRKVPTEWSGTVAITRKAAFQIEHLSWSSAGRSMPIEHGRNIMVKANVQLEHLSGIIRDGLMRIEKLMQVAASKGLSIEHLVESGNLKRSAPAEWLAAMTRPGQAPVEYASVVCRSGQVHVEWRGNVVAGRSVAVEYVSGLVADRSVPAEWQSLVTAQRQAVQEYLADLSRKAEVPMESLGVVSITRKAAVPIEHLAGLDATKSVPNEALLLADARRRIQQEGLAALDRKVMMPIEHLGAVSITRKAAIPIEYLSSVTVDRQVSVEDLASLEATRQLNLEYKSSIVRLLKANIEHGVTFTANLAVPVEHLQVLIRKAEIPLEWSGLTFTAIAIANASLTGATMVNVTLTQPELANLLLLMTKLDNVTITEVNAGDVVLALARFINIELKGGSQWPK